MSYDVELLRAVKQFEANKEIVEAIRELESSRESGGIELMGVAEEVGGGTDLMGAAEEVEERPKKSGAARGAGAAQSFGPARSEEMRKQLEKMRLGLAERAARVRRRSRVKGSGKGRSGIGLATCKEQGEWAQLVFMARARQLGVTVLMPYGDSRTYDVGLDIDARLVRVQVKSTTFLRKGTFELNLVGPGREMYQRGDLDIFAIYVAPLDVWYIFPFGMLEGMRTLQLRPDDPQCKWHGQFEAWGELWKCEFLVPNT
jgi:hypothetical protein